MEGLRERLTSPFGYSIFRCQGNNGERGLGVTPRPLGETKAEIYPAKA